jgi:hypothetical protein
MKTLSKRVAEELKSLATVTYRKEEVPTQWVPIHGKIAWRAVSVQDKRKKLTAYGLKSDWYLAGLLNLKSRDDVVGDFSFIRCIP